MNAIDYLQHARYWIDKREPQRALTCLDEAAHRLGELANNVDLELHEERIGVIVGVDGQLTIEQSAHIREELSDAFPGVTFAVMPATSSIWFPLPSDPKREPDAQ